MVSRAAVYRVGGSSTDNNFHTRSLQNTMTIVVRPRMRTSSDSPVERSCSPTITSTTMQQPESPDILPSGNSSSNGVFQWPWKKSIVSSSPDACTSSPALLVNNAFTKERALSSPVLSSLNISPACVKTTPNCSSALPTTTGISSMSSPKISHPSCVVPPHPPPPYRSSVSSNTPTDELHPLQEINPCQSPPPVPVALRPPSPPPTLYPLPILPPDQLTTATTTTSTSKQQGVNNNRSPPLLVRNCDKASSPVASPPRRSRRTLGAYIIDTTEDSFTSTLNCVATTTPSEMLDDGSTSFEPTKKEIDASVIFFKECGRKSTNTATTYSTVRSQQYFVSASSPKRQQQPSYTMHPPGTFTNVLDEIPSCT